MIKCTHTSGKAQTAVQVYKERAKAGRKGMLKARIIQGVANGMEKSVIAAFITGLAVFKRRINADEFERLVRENRIDEAIEIIPWDQLETDLRALDGLIAGAFLGSGEKAIELMPAPPKELRIGPENPALKRFIDETVGLRIVGIKDEARRAVSNVVTAQLQNGLNVQRTADLLKVHVGLTERQSVRIMNLQLADIQRRERLQSRLNLLNAQGLGASRSASKVKRDLADLTDQKIELRTLRRSESAANQRARAIARTELNRAVNAGQMLVWNEAADQGLIDRDKQVKVWVTIPDNDRSEICADLDGVRVGLDEQFYVAQTGELVDHPPAHPNCRSSLVLEDAPE